MPSESRRINVVEKVFVVFGKHSVRLDNELLAGGVHLDLCLLPIRLADSKPRALVRLDFVNDVVLAVEVDSESHPILSNLFNSYLTVAPLDAEMVKDTMLIRRSRRRVLICEVILGKTELHVPPLGEGVRIPIAHHSRRIARAEPTRP